MMMVPNAFSLRSLDTLSDLAAALAGTLQIFIWPPLVWAGIMYFRVVPEQQRAKGDAAEEASLPGQSSRGHVAHLALSALMVVVGVCVAIFGAIGALVAS
jgi:hypothetical protein